MIHKSIHFWITALVCVVNLTFAQSSFEQHQARYSTLQPYTPSGILADRSPHHLAANDSVKAAGFYPGSGRNTSAYHYKQLYNWAYQAVFDVNNWIEPRSLSSHIDSARLGFSNAQAPWPQVAQNQSRADVMMGSLFLEYNEVAPDAFENNYIFYDEQVDKFKLRLNPYQHTDTVWLSGTPGSGNYQVQTYTFTPNQAQTLGNWKNQKQLCVLTALDRTVIVGPGQPIRFAFDQHFNKSNIAGASLEVDFDDGQGFRVIQIGMLVSTLANRSGEVILKYRVRASNGMLVGDLVNTTNIFIVRSKRMNDLSFYSSNPASCSILLNEGVGEAQLNFALSPYSNGRLTKPFILVEGFETTMFDKTNAELDLKSNGGFGALNWFTLNSSQLSSIGFEQLSNLPDLIDSLLGVGFDVGFVDFRTNRARVEKNANALVSLLQQVGNILDQNGSSEGIQLMGASMGGLIARDALVRMEKAGCCHEVKVYYSFSTPHKGANIPIGLQHFVYDLGTKFNILGANEDYRLTYTQVLNSPAARQMIIIHKESSAYTDHISFIQYQNQMGLPQQVKRIALTDASLSGHLQRMNNDDEFSPLIQELQTLFDFKLAVWAPLDFPVPDDFSGRKYTLMDAKGRVMPHSPNVQSSDWIYYSGRSASENFANISQQYLRLFRGYGFIALNILFHEAAKVIFPTFVIPIMVSQGVVAQGIISYHKNQLNNAIVQHEQMNIAQRNYRIVPRASEGYDNAPGDYRSLLGSLEAGEIHLFSEILPHHAFVHVSSSINESLSSRTVYISNSSQTPFSGHFEKYNGVRYMTKPEYKNEKHVSLFSNRRMWLLDAVKTYCNSDLVINSNVNLGYIISSNPFEIKGNESFDIFSNILVNNQGKLNLNRQNLLYNNLGFSFLPVANSTLVFTTLKNSCQETIIDNYGEIELGEPVGSTYSNTADVNLLSNSRLILRNGSILRVNQHSKLLLDSGSTLEIHGNPIIFIEENGELEIRGKVIYADSSSLSIDGSGKLILNPYLAHNEDSRCFIRATQGKLVAFGSGTLNNRIIILRPVFLPEGLEVRIERLGIRMAENTRLDITGSVVLRNVRVSKLGLGNHDGIVLHGQNKVAINDVTISGASKGITALLVHRQNSLTLNNVFFVNNEIGLETHGKSVRLNGNSFINNGSGWIGYDIEGINEVKNSTFTDNHTGINVMGQGDADLSISQTSIQNNRTGIQSFGQLYVRLNCNDISSNMMGIYAGNYQLLLGGGARNRFNNNQLAIKLEEVDNLYLTDGENDFTGSNMYISGSFSGIALNYLSFNSLTQGYEIDILNNRMPIIGGDTKMLLRDWDLNPVYGRNFTPMPFGILSCEPHQQMSHVDFVLSNFLSQTTVNTGSGNQSLNAAILEARLHISIDDTFNTGNHLLALNKFNALFGSWRALNGSPEISGNNSVLYDLALNLTLKAHNNAYRFGEIVLNRANPSGILNSYTANVIHELDTRINELLGSGLAIEPDRIWNLQLLKAQVLRTAEHYGLAKQELSSIHHSAIGDWVSIANYWYCVCDVEEQLILGQISPLEFESGRLGCANLVPTSKFELPLTGDRAKDVVVERNYTLYPNPASDYFYIRSENPIGSAIITLFDVNGVEIDRSTWSNRGELFEKRLNDLPSGAYQVRITDNEKVVNNILIIH